MEEAAKNRIVLVLAALTVIFFVTSVSSCFNTRREKADREKEMGLRMDLEEKLGKATTELKNNIGELNRTLNEEKKSHEATKAALAEAQSLNNNLTLELEKTNKLKDTLEGDLKDALVSPSQKSKP
jgi:septal ring factor EnvC (AmiA/AmiB activator)